MSGNQSTFDCGAFLPGRGPYNFPDYNPGGGVGGPGGNGDPQVPPGGAQRPPTGGDVKKCECRIYDVGSPEFLGTTPPGGSIAEERIGRKFYRIPLFQKCFEIINGLPPNDNQQQIDTLRTAISNRPKHRVTSTNVFPGGEPCGPPGGQCDGPCSTIYIHYFVDDENVIPGPTTPGPTTTGPGSGSDDVFMCKINNISGPVKQGGSTGGQENWLLTMTQECVRTTTPAEGAAVVAHNSSKKQEAESTIAAFLIAYNVPGNYIRRDQGESGKVCQPGVACEEITIRIAWFPFTNSNEPIGPVAPRPISSGPSTPPGGVGSDKNCRCIISGPPTVTTIGTETVGGEVRTYRTATFLQECTNVDNIVPPPQGNNKIIQDFIFAYNTPNTVFTDVPSARKYGGRCKDPQGNCTETCDSYVLSFYVVNEGEGGNTSTPINGGTIFNGVGDVGEDPDPGGGVTGTTAPGGVFLPGTVGEDEDPDPPTLFPKGPNSLNPFTIVPDRVGEGGVTSASVNVNLAQNNLVERLLNNNPYGLQDPEIAVDFVGRRTVLVSRGYRGPSDIWADQIDSSVDYFLRNRAGDWDFSMANSLTANNIRRSLSPESREVLDSIRTYSGQPLSDTQIMSLIGTRLIRGDISEITHSFLAGLQAVTKNNNDVALKTSGSQEANELAVIQMLEAYSFPMNTESQGWSVEKIKNYSALATDVDRHLLVRLSDEEEPRKVYLSDSNKVISNVDTIRVQDGNFFNINVSEELGIESNTIKLPTSGEEDHVLLVPERVRQKSLRALGGNPLRTLEVSSSWSEDSIETDQDLQNSRQTYYFLSANLDTINTKPIYGSSRLLHETEINYEFVEVTSQEDVDSINEFIKHKIDNVVYMLNDSDLIFDYLEQGKDIKLRQQDIITRVAKGNKSKSLLTRQIPSYILLVPTTRADLLVFDETSHVVSLENDTIVRQLQVDVNISKTFSNTYNNQFIKQSTVGKYGTDVYGNQNTQARISFLEKDDTLYSETHRDYSDGRLKLTSAQEAEVYRTKTGIRIFNDIVQELDNNYGLNLNGLGKTLTEFDVFSRFNAREWSLLVRTENWEELKRSFYTGLVNDVSITASLDSSDSQVAIRKTHLILRKPLAAEEDAYPSIKTTASGYKITPPSNTEPAKLTRIEEKQENKFPQGFNHIIP